LFSLNYRPGIDPRFLLRKNAQFTRCCGCAGAGAFERHAAGGLPLLFPSTFSATRALRIAYEGVTGSWALGGGKSLRGSESRMALKAD
jgi:hypothetical protein